MAWEAVRLAAAAAVLAAGGFWVSYTAMEAVFGSAPVQYLPAPPSSASPAKGHPAVSPPPQHRRPGVPRRASVAPVSAVPVPSRRPARRPAPAPARSTPRTPHSPAPTLTPTPVPVTPSAGSTAPPTATPTATPTDPLPPPGAGTGTWSSP